MKFTLDLEEQKYPEKGRNDDRYKFFKKQLMSHTYDSLRSIFQSLADCSIIEKTTDNEDVKDGYKPTVSGGSGYINSSSFNKWVERTFPK